MRCCHVMYYAGTGARCCCGGKRAAIAPLLADSPASLCRRGQKGWCAGGGPRPDSCTGGQCHAQQPVRWSASWHNVAADNWSPPAARGPAGQAACRARRRHHHDAEATRRPSAAPRAAESGGGGEVACGPTWRRCAEAPPAPPPRPPGSDDRTSTGARRRPGPVVSSPPPRPALVAPLRPPPHVSLSVASTPAPSRLAHTLAKTANPRASSLPLGFASS